MLRVEMERHAYATCAVLDICCSAVTGPSVPSHTFSSTWVKPEADPSQPFLLLIISTTPTTCPEEEDAFYVTQSVL